MRRKYLIVGGITILGLFLFGLFQFCVSVQMVQKNKLSSFHISVANADIEEIEAILKITPEIVNERGSNNSISLHWAALQGSIHAEELGTDEYYLNMLEYQSNRDYLSVIKLLLDNGADINAVGDNGWTPLHLSAAYGQLDVVKLLVRRGANIEIKDAQMKMAIDRALESGKYDIARYLESVLPDQSTGYVEHYIQTFKEEPEFRKYSDEDVAFLYPKDVRLKVDNKTKIYNLAKVDVYSLSLAFYPHDMMSNIEEELAVKSESQYIKNIYLGKRSFGSNEAKVKIIDALDKEKNPHSRQYRMILYSNGRSVLIDIFEEKCCISTIDSYATILSSVNIK